jgi:hypothetical protein
LAELERRDAGLVQDRGESSPVGCMPLIRFRPQAAFLSPLPLLSGEQSSCPRLSGRTESG